MKHFWWRPKRGDLHMCKKIKEINALTPDSILEKYWDKKIPVNVKYILARASILFRPNDFSNLEESLGLDKNDAILGLAFSDCDDLGILYSSHIDEDATNYVLAHELAHCCLHLEPTEEFHVELKISNDLYSASSKKSFLDGYINSYKELRADQFAADLLIPTRALREFVLRNHDVSVENIAKHFHVSKEIVRFKNMNLRRSRAGELK